MPSRNLTTIFFDIDDTLFSTTVFAEKARRNAVEAMIRAGIRADRELLLKELNEVIAEFSSNYDKHFDKLMLRIPPSSYAGMNPAFLVASGVMAYHETKSQELKVHDDAYLLLRDLARTRIRLGIISAGLTIKQMEKIVRLKIYEFLDPMAIFISEQMGISKPNPKIYLKACQELGISPESAMYVGDHPKNDIDPPKKIGMITVWHRRGGSKHIQEAAQSIPDYTVTNFLELREILVRDFGLDLSAGS
ncbi:MAG: TIGR02253 family HAD-type hydrolase [Planctomycetes bacterium]|nr:TIGR02253 family HAD-type hydrolase [Planctomycetota bacterium]